MKLLHILKSKKGMAAELVAISLMFVFTVLSVSALLTANSVLRGVQSDYSEEQAKIYAITLSQAIGNQLTMYNSIYADADGNPMPDVYTQYDNDLNNPYGSSVSSNLSSYLYDKYFANYDKSNTLVDVSCVTDLNPSLKPDCKFDISARFYSPSASWDDFYITITTKATYKGASYSIKKSYTLVSEDPSVPLGDKVPCYWHEV